MLGMNCPCCIPAISTFDVCRLSAPFSVGGRFVHGRYSPGGAITNDIRFLTTIDNAPGFLSFVSDYAVFIRPIIIAGVFPDGLPNHQYGSNLIPFSTGLYTAPGLTSLRCIGLVAGKSTPVE